MDQCLEDFLSELRNAHTVSCFVRATLSKYRGDADLQRIEIRPVDLNSGSKLSFTYSGRTKDIVKNLSLSDAQRELSHLIGRDFLSATLFTTVGDLFLEYSRKRVPRLKRGKAVYAEVGKTEHNRKKEYLVSEQAPFLLELGIANKKGVLQGKQDKYRQVNKFIETVRSLTDEREAVNSAVDFGSGKHYLTFALYEYLNSRNPSVKVTGVEQREELVRVGEQVAKKVGFGGLSFSQGTIQSYQPNQIDLVVALHACDTATDEAIAKGINVQAATIIVAPCCHKYVRARLRLPQKLKPIFKHGILEESFAVSLTDGLRALCLEIHGYKTKVFEFIEPEHTSKNLMIVATRAEDNARKGEALKELNQIKAEFGISDIYLDRILGLV